MDEVVAADQGDLQLEPKPGRNYITQEPQYITPDVYVHMMGDRYVPVSTTTASEAPHLPITTGGRSRTGMGEGEAKEYIQDKLRSAVWLIRSIHQRQRTIYKVTESIVKFQRDFFDKGVAAPQAADPQGRGRRHRHARVHRLARHHQQVRPHARRASTS